MASSNSDSKNYVQILFYRIFSCAYTLERNVQILFNELKLSEIPSSGRDSSECECFAFVCVSTNTNYCTLSSLFRSFQSARASWSAGARIRALANVEINVWTMKGKKWLCDQALNRKLHTNGTVSLTLSIEFNRDNCTMLAEEKKSLIHIWLRRIVNGQRSAHRWNVCVAQIQHYINSVAGCCCCRGCYSRKKHLQKVFEFIIVNMRNYDLRARWKRPSVCLCVYSCARCTNCVVMRTLNNTMKNKMKLNERTSEKNKSPTFACKCKKKKKKRDRIRRRRFAREHV